MARCRSCFAGLQGMENSPRCPLISRSICPDWRWCGFGRTQHVARGLGWEGQAPHVQVPLTPGLYLSRLRPPAASSTAQCSPAGLHSCISNSQAGPLQQRGEVPAGGEPAKGPLLLRLHFCHLVISPESLRCAQLV